MASITIYPLDNYKIGKKDGKPSKVGNPAASRAPCQPATLQIVNDTEVKVHALASCRNLPADGSSSVKRTSHANPKDRWWTVR